MELINLVSSVIIFSIELTQMDNFPTRILKYASDSLAFWIYLSSGPSVCSTMTFPPLANSDHVVVSVSIYVPSNSQWDASFHRIARVE